MQTFTLFFGFAIVAIAMENLTSKLHFVKTSDVDVKDPQGIQSRIKAKITIKYLLAGTTGKEKVIITDGKMSKQVNLTKDYQELTANNRIITINYINDECCTPDRNVLFTTGLDVEISTGDNIPNYRSNWECSSQPAICPTTRNTTNHTTIPMHLLSRQQKADLCRVVAKTDTCDGTDAKCKCDNCKILDQGQLCHPGNYTIEFKITNQCKGVTFGECNLDKTEKVMKPFQLPTKERCWQQCKSITKCKFYRYDYKTKLCTLLDNSYAQFCNVQAGPENKRATECLWIDNNQRCDAEIEEDCEYTGELLMEYPSGAIVDANECQELCQSQPEVCKYWIHDTELNLCIHKRDGGKICNVEGGPKAPTFNECLAIKNNSTA